MDRRRKIAIGTVLLGIGLSATHLFDGDVAPAALASVEIPAANPPAAPEPAPRAVTKLEPTAPVIPATVSDRTGSPAPLAGVQPEAPVADACAPTLDLLPEPDAMIGITLIAPCHPGARVVLAHDGLAVTLRTTATGSVFTSIPALSVAGMVTARLPDGTEVTTQTDMPEAASYGRLAVQWQGDDRFSLNAYAPAAVYGGAGHEQAVALADIPAGTSLMGRVIRLGSPDVDLPLLAEVYTHPRGDRNSLTIEAEVTATTCGREMLGETIKSRDGQVTVQDLTLAMPDCDAMGEFLVLNIAPADLTLAQAE